MSQHIDPTPKQTDLQTLSDSLAMQLYDVSVTGGGTAHLTKIGQIVHLRLEIGTANLTTNVSMGTLPEGYRPRQLTSVPCCVVTDSNFTDFYPCTIEISTEGAMKPRFGNNKKGIVLYCSTVFMTA